MNKVKLITGEYRNNPSYRRIAASAPIEERFWVHPLDKAPVLTLIDTVRWLWKGNNAQGFKTIV